MGQCCGAPRAPEDERKEKKKDTEVDLFVGTSTEEGMKVYVDVLTRGKGYRSFHNTTRNVASPFFREGTHFYGHLSKFTLADKPKQSVCTVGDSYGGFDVRECDKRIVEAAARPDCNSVQTTPSQQITTHSDGTINVYRTVYNEDKFHKINAQSCDVKIAKGGYSIQGAYYSVMALGEDGNLHAWQFVKPTLEETIAALHGFKVCDKETEDTAKYPRRSMLTSPNSLPITTFSAGFHTVFATEDGSVYSCGHKSKGSFHRSFSFRHTWVTEPERIPLPATVLKVKLIVTGKDDRVVVITDDGVFCWGEDKTSYRHTDKGWSATYKAKPRRLKALDSLNIVHASLSESNYYASAVADTGDVYVWCTHPPDPSWPDLSEPCVVARGEQVVASYFVGKALVVVHKTDKPVEVQNSETTQ